LDLVQSSGVQGGVALGKDGIDSPAKLLFPNLQLLLIKRGLDSSSTSSLDECCCFKAPSATCFDDKRDECNIVTIVTSEKRFLVLRSLFQCHPGKLRTAEGTVARSAWVDDCYVNEESCGTRSNTDVHHTASSRGTWDGKLLAGFREGEALVQEMKHSVHYQGVADGANARGEAAVEGVVVIHACHQCS
jgi:hypothetical protein